MTAGTALIEDSAETGSFLIVPSEGVILALNMGHISATALRRAGEILTCSGRGWH